MAIKMQLIIGNKNYSSWSLRPWLLLSHFNLQFEEIRIPLDTPEFTTTLAQYSAAGKVPVLQDKGAEIWDSLAICEYVSEQYLGGKGWPVDPLARAQARSASAEMHSSFMAIRSNMPMNCRSSRVITISSEMREEIRRIDQLWGQLRDTYASKGNFLFGDFSIADCMFAPVASRFNTYQPELGETSQNYVEAIINTPAMQQWYAQATQETEVLEKEETGQPRI
jgi:glutathione S-transferase